MNGVLAVAASATATPDTIGGNTENLSSMHKHRQMKTGTVCLSHATGVGVLQETLQQGIMPLTRGLNTGRHDIHGQKSVQFIKPAKFQFYARGVQRSVAFAAQ